jgi:hypothetical protein
VNELRGLTGSSSGEVAALDEGYFETPQGGIKCAACPRSTTTDDTDVK